MFNCHGTTPHGKGETVFIVGNASPPAAVAWPDTVAGCELGLDESVTPGVLSAPCTLWAWRKPPTVGPPARAEGTSCEISTTSVSLDYNIF